MDPDNKRELVNEIGLFYYGKTEWLQYREKIEQCFNEHFTWNDDHKKDVVVAAIGGKTLKILKNLLWPNDLTQVCYNVVMEKLESHFYGDADRPYWIKKFYVRKQRTNETFFQYVLELRKLMGNANFGKNTHKKMKNQILDGAKEELKQVLPNRNFTLSEIFEIGLKFDDDRALKGVPHPRNHKARKNRVRTCFRCNEPLRLFHTNQSCPFDWAVCSFCKVKGHVAVACKYKNKNCNKCGEKGHIAKLCKKKNQQSAPLNVVFSGLYIVNPVATEV